MQVATKLALLCAGVVLLLTSPIASQEQCTIPTEQDVKDVANQIYQALVVEGTSPNTVQDVLEVHFTCLATVALDMYASATVVANFTINNSSGSIVDQFQLVCDGGMWQKSSMSGFESTSGSLPSMPFGIATQFQCSNCEEITVSIPHYNTKSNCLSCVSECLNIGGGFCTGNTANDCCPFFNSTGDCVDNCTTIHANFGPDENFTCVCKISCPFPGYGVNTINCTCELTDGCEAAGQPCQNGGNCTNNSSAILEEPYYTCTCANGFSGQNCTVCNISCEPGYTQNTTDCLCQLTDRCEAAGQPCQNGGTCTSNIITPVGEPYYTCSCANGFSGQNCLVSVTSSNSFFIPAPTSVSTSGSITTTSGTPTTHPEECNDRCIILVVLGVAALLIGMISVVLLVCLYFCINGGRKRNEEGAELTAVVRPGNNEANSTSQENLDNEKHPEGQRGGSTM